LPSIQGNVILDSLRYEPTARALGSFGEPIEFGQCGFVEPNSEGGRHAYKSIEAMRFGCILASIPVKLNHL
jgi:hypothetical protein